MILQESLCNVKRTFRLVHGQVLQRGQDRVEPQVRGTHSQNFVGGGSGLVSGILTFLQSVSIPEKETQNKF